MSNKLNSKVLSNNSKIPSCERIWVGKYKDDIGTFEILVPACNRDKATDIIKTCLDNIKNGEMRVTQKIVQNSKMLSGEPDLIYIINSKVLP